MISKRTANYSPKLMAVYMLAALLGLLVLGGSAFGQESALPVRYNATTLQGDGAVCPPTDQRDAARANISEDIRSLIRISVLPVIQGNQGYGACGCGGPGWTRIAYLDMTDPTQQCPQNWNLITTPKRTCGRSTSGCSSAIFSNNGGLQYSQVCGQIVSYQYGHPDGFNTRSIDTTYVDGVSLTHGSPREHIWSFAAARDEGYILTECPCTSTTAAPHAPSFVGYDYFCESGAPAGTAISNTFFTDNPLWDGDSCVPTSTCCSFNDPPWFCKQLPQTTTDDLEVRICASVAPSGEDTPIELMEIYVK